MDAISLLKADHDLVKSLLADLESTTERGVKTRTELFARIKQELTVHEVIEEEIFYPELKAHPKAEDIVLEGFEEHHVVDLLLGELSAPPVGLLRNARRRAVAGGWHALAETGWSQSSRSAPSRRRPRVAAARGLMSE